MEFLRMYDIWYKKSYLFVNAYVQAEINFYRNINNTS